MNSSGSDQLSRSRFSPPPGDRWTARACSDPAQRTPTLSGKVSASYLLVVCEKRNAATCCPLKSVFQPFSLFSTYGLVDGLLLKTTDQVQGNACGHCH